MCVKMCNMKLIGRKINSEGRLKAVLGVRINQLDKEIDIEMSSDPQNGIAAIESDRLISNNDLYLLCWALDLRWLYAKLGGKQ